MQAALHAIPMRMQKGGSRAQRSCSKTGRWQARRRLEDQRQATLRSAVTSTHLDKGVPSPTSLLGRPAVHVTDPAEEAMKGLQDALSELDAAAQFPGPDSERLDSAVSNVIDALWALPAFQSKTIQVNSTVEAHTGRFLVDSFVVALESACARVRTVPVVFDEFVDAVTQTFANTAASRYEQPASTAWPQYTALCTELTARFQLEQSGLVTYTLGPSDASASWELTGEGCWRIFPEGGRVTEVELVMRHGLQGVAPEADGTAVPVREPPCVLRIDLCKCARTMLDGSNGDDEGEDGEEEDDGEGEDDA